MRRKVKRVIDGNTFEVYRKVNGTNFIRLTGLEVPPKHTSAGKNAALRLRNLIGGKMITLFPKGRSYRRV